MRKRAEVVIVGSGGFGASTAYHLARRGVRDVILLDRYDLGSQTSPRAAGLTSKVAASELMVKLVNEAVETLAAFESVTGRRSGSIASAPCASSSARRARADAPRRGVGGVLRGEGRVPVGRQRPSGGRPTSARPAPAPSCFRPEDGYFHPPLVAREFAAAAGEIGVTLAPGTAVTGFVHEGGRIRGARTAAGVIESPVVVDAAGAWTSTPGGRGGHPHPDDPHAPPAVHHRADPRDRAPSPHRQAPRAERVHATVGGLMFGGYEDHPLQIDMRKQPEGFQIRDLTLDVGVLWGLAPRWPAHFPALRGARLHEHRGGLPTISADGATSWDRPGGLAASTSPRPARWGASPSPPPSAALSRI